MKKIENKEIDVVEIFPKYENEEAKQEAISRLVYDLAVINAKYEKRKKNTA